MALTSNYGPDTPTTPAAVGPVSTMIYVQCLVPLLSLCVVLSAGSQLYHLKPAGQTVDPANYTTLNARTYLQPQFNKAVKFSKRRTVLERASVRGKSNNYDNRTLHQDGDNNCKDYILFQPDLYRVPYTHRWGGGGREECFG
jgi:hypothetical protein